MEQKIVIAMETVESNSLNLNWTSLDLELKAYAKEHHVPIIMDDGLALLEKIIQIQKPKHILEIGTAIGYSAIRMHQVCGSKITTIERNPEMIAFAKRTIVKAGLEDEIHLIEADALNAFDLVKNTCYDLIFIDAAKAQYQKFFEIYSPLLTQNGIIISDNMGFHGLVNETSSANLSRSVRGLIRKLEGYRQFLLNNPKFDTSIFEIGDGLAISTKKDEYAYHRKNL